MKKESVKRRSEGSCVGADETNKKANPGTATGLLLLSPSQINGATIGGTEKKGGERTALWQWKRQERASPITPRIYYVRLSDYTCRIRE